MAQSHLQVIQFDIVCFTFHRKTKQVGYLDYSFELNSSSFEISANPIEKLQGSWDPDSIPLKKD